MEFQARSKAVLRESTVVGFGTVTAILSTAQQASIGDKSGEFGGQS
jgi:hypothetical protein